MHTRRPHASTLCVALVLGAFALGACQKESAAPSPALAVAQSDAGVELTPEDVARYLAFEEALLQLASSDGGALTPAERLRRTTALRATHGVDARLERLLDDASALVAAHRLSRPPLSPATRASIDQAVLGLSDKTRDRALGALLGLAEGGDAGEAGWSEAQRVLGAHNLAVVRAHDDALFGVFQRWAKVLVEASADR